jgi:hypothetical protein
MTPSSLPLHYRLAATLAAIVLAGACDDAETRTDGGADGGAADATPPRDATRDDAGTETRAPDAPGCHPIVPRPCTYPFPNMRMVEADESTPTGYRVALTAETLGFLSDDDGTREPFVEYLNEADGFSQGTPILAQLGDQEVDASLLPAWNETDSTLEPTSPVQLFDMETAERVRVWAELDRRADDPRDQSLMIRQSVGLAPGHVHLAVITTGLTAADGSELVPSDAFAALRDDAPSDSLVVEGMRSEYETVFAFLEEQGVAREDVVLAWRFVTVSDDFAVSQGLDTTQATVAALQGDVDVPCPSDGCAELLSITIDSCATSVESEAEALGCRYDDGLHSTVWRQIHGTFTAPTFLDAETGRMRFDEAGNPTPTGRMEAELVVHVPMSLRGAEPETAPILVFGHGLLSNPSNYIANATDANGVMTLADRRGAVTVGTRWLGLGSDDLELAGTSVVDLSVAPQLGDRLVQGMANTIALVPAAQGPLASHALLSTGNGSGSLIDAERVYYHGISQGGIFGTTFMALSPHVKTGVLHVPTSMYTLNLQHSSQFAAFQLIMDGAWPEPLDQQLFLGYATRVFDPLDPIAFARHLAEDGLTALGAKNCLWQVNWGDKAALDVYAYAMVRTADAPSIAPVTHEIEGIATVEAPTAPNQSGMVIFDPGLGRTPLRNDMGSASPRAHQATRRNDEVIDQAVRYLAADGEGTIELFCGDGPCSVDPVPLPGEDEYP